MEPFDSMAEKLNEWFVEKPVEWAGDQIKDFFIDLAVDFVTVTPILAGVSIGVYALVGMVSKGFARLSVAGVFGYGAILVIFA
jgi:hypothetical protein